LSRQIVIACLLLFDGGDLARRFGTEISQRVGNGFAIFLIALRNCQNFFMHNVILYTHIALQYQVVHQVDDLSHGDFFSALSPGRMRELDRLAIAQ
jgi:hypothetical protein